MNISFDQSAAAIKYAKSVLNNPKISLSEQQKSDVERIIKTESLKSETYIKSSAVSSLTANPYNPFYGVSEPTSPYNYTAADGQSSNTFLTKPHTYKALHALSLKLDSPQNLAMQKFEYLRSQL